MVAIPTILEPLDAELFHEIVLLAFRKEGNWRDLVKATSPIILEASYML
jgi:hypothetical protein